MPAETADLPIKSETIQRTQKLLGKYVKKPPLTEKLLAKPPFRFLHDIINTVIKDTGFLSGLFTVDELNSDNVKERDAKVAFLRKLIDAIKAVTKTDLAVRPSKIVAGLEPIETNLLLQTIGEAIHKKIDTSDYVRQQSLMKGSTDKIKSNQDDKKKSTGSRKGAGSSDKNSKKSTKTTSKDDIKKGVVGGAPRKTIAIDKKKSPNQIVETPKSTDRSSNKSSSKSTPRAETTHKKSLESQKSSSDINRKKIKSTIKSNQKEKKKVVPKDENQDGIILDKSTENNEAIILEQPTSTMSTFDDDKIEIRRNEDHPEEHQILEPSATTTTIVTSEVTASSDIAVNSVKPSEDLVEEKRPGTSTALVRPKSAHHKQRGGSGGGGDKTTATKSPAPERTNTTNNVRRPNSSLRPPSVRPSSARPAAPRLRPDSALPVHEVVALGKINVIVENFDAAHDGGHESDDADETVVKIIENDASDDNAVADSATAITTGGDNPGHLVEQILEQINNDQDASAETLMKNKRNASSMDLGESGDGLLHDQSTAKEINHLRVLIQTLTKTANPLGKLMNYLHEDIDAMHSELEMWNTTKRQLFKEIGKQKKISSELNQPLLEQLASLNDEIKKQEQEIINARSNILRNELKIKDLLTK